MIEYVWMPDGGQHHSIRKNAKKGETVVNEIWRRKTPFHHSFGVFFLSHFQAIFNAHNMVWCFYDTKSAVYLIKSTSLFSFWQRAQSSNTCKLRRARAHTSKWNCEKSHLLKTMEILQGINRKENSIQRMNWMGAKQNVINNEFELKNRNYFFAPFVWLSNQ